MDEIDFEIDVDDVAEKLSKIDVNNNDGDEIKDR